jgi:hypothetical protein
MGRDELDAMSTWRRDRLLSVGFDRELAARLATTPGVDLHALLSLLDRGCPPSLAARIMAPDCETAGEESW